MTLLEWRKDATALNCLNELDGFTSVFRRGVSKRKIPQNLLHYFSGGGNEGQT